ncbi:hypothetical protein D3C83_157740 [compost metagenome]
MRGISPAIAAVNVSTSNEPAGTVIVVRAFDRESFACSHTTGTWRMRATSSERSTFTSTDLPGAICGEASPRAQDSSASS